MTIPLMENFIFYAVSKKSKVSSVKSKILLLYILNSQGEQCQKQNLTFIYT